MARKSSIKKGGSRPKTKSFNKADGKLNKWNTISDIPLDEEDQFHASRDKILLDDPYGSRGHPDDEDDDEVFALKGLEDDSDEDAEVYEDDEEEEEFEEPLKAAPEPKKKSKKSKAKAKAGSDEEEEEEESWGKGKAAYYSSNADELESDDEEGHELEEQESRRLQKKARQELHDEDFGLNDNPELERKDDPLDLDEPAPVPVVELPTDKAGLLKHLQKTNPEALALVNDWEDTVYNLEKTKAYLAVLEKEDPDSMSLGMIHIYYQALLSYTTMLSFFFHLRASPKYTQKPSLLQSHPIMQRLLTLKQSLQTMQDLHFAIPGSDDEEELSDDEGSYGEGMDMSMEEILQDGEQLWRLDAQKGLEPNELSELLQDAEEDFDMDDAQVTTKRPKKKRKVAKSKEEDASSSSVVKPVFDLVEPEFVSTKASSSRHRSNQDVADAYGEATTLNSVDAADKSARKKSLRFHTSKIESASARRQGARNQAAGGDDDIPYRERKNEKDARLVKEAARRAAQQGGEDLDPEGDHQVGEKRPRGDDDDDGNDSPDEYYELVKKKSKEKKEKKKVEYEEEHGRVRVDNTDEAAGPRGLTRAILSNKGLTPHRPKAVRNPRVKKRQKYEQAKKKLASQKAVYKGGLSEVKGRYDGEKSGISKVVKSVKLG